MLIVHRPPLGINLPRLLGPVNPESGFLIQAEVLTSADALLPTRSCQAPLGVGKGRKGPRTGREAFNQNAGRHVAESLDIEQDTQTATELLLYIPSKA